MGVKCHVACLLAVAGDGGARQSLKLMEEGMKHLEEFQTFLKRPKVPATRDGTTNRPRRRRSDSRRSRSQPADSPRPSLRSDDNQSCRSSVPYRQPSASHRHGKPTPSQHSTHQHSEKRSAHQHSDKLSARRRSDSRCRANVSQGGQLARGQRRSLSHGHLGRSPSWERSARTQGQSAKSQSYCGQTRIRQSDHDGSYSHVQRGQHDGCADHGASDSKARSGGSQKQAATGHREGRGSHCGHSHSSRHYDQRSDRYGQADSPYDESADSNDQRVSSYDRNANVYEQRASRHNPSADRRPSRYSHDDSQRHHHGHQGQTMVLESENRNQSARHWPQQLNHSTPKSSRLTGPAAPRPGLAPPRRTIPNTYQQRHVQHRAPYAGSYSHLNISQNYNCEDSDRSPSHGLTDVPAETGRGSGRQGADPGGRQGASHGGPETGAAISTARPQRRGRKRASRPWSGRAGPHGKAQCSVAGSQTTLGHRNAYRGQDSDTSSGDSYRKEETISLAEKLFGLKLTSRKRWSGSHRKRPAVKKRSRAAEGRPLLGGSSSCDSEDTTREASKGTEPVDSGYDPSTSLPSETRRTEPYRLDRLSPLTVDPLDRDQRLTADPVARDRRDSQSAVPVREGQDGLWSCLALPPLLPATGDPAPGLSLDSPAPGRHTEGGAAAASSTPASEGRQQQPGPSETNRTPTASRAERKVGTELNPADLQALSTEDDKEFRMRATQRWCQQQNQPVGSPRSLSPLPSVSQKKTDRGVSSDLSIVPGGHSTKAPGSPAPCRLHTDVRRTEEAPHLFPELQTTPSSRCESTSQGECYDDNLSANRTRSTGGSDFSSLDETEPDNCLETANIGSDVDNMDFKIPSSSSDAVEYFPRSECRQLTGSDSDSSGSFGDLAKERVKSGRQHEDSAFSPGGPGGRESGASSAARQRDGGGDDESVRVTAVLHTLATERATKPQTLAACGPEEPFSPSRFRSGPSERQSAQKPLFPDEAGTVEATVRSSRRSAERVGQHLSPSVLPVLPALPARVFRAGP